VPDPDRAGIVDLIDRWRVNTDLRVAEIVWLFATEPRLYPAPLPGRQAAAGGWTARVRAILTDPRYTGRAVLRPARRDPATGWTPAVLTPAGTPSRARRRRRLAGRAPAVRPSTTGSPGQPPPAAVTVAGRAVEAAVTPPPLHLAVGSPVGLAISSAVGALVDPLTVVAALLLGPGSPSPRRRAVTDPDPVTPANRGS
jgi:hypothetical protein